MHSVVEVHIVHPFFIILWMYRNIMGLATNVILIEMMIIKQKENDFTLC